MDLFLKIYTPPAISFDTSPLTDNKVKNLNISSRFEKTLNEIDLINTYSINRFDKDFIFYVLIDIHVEYNVTHQE